MSNDELRDVVDGPQADPDDTVQYVRDDHRVYTTGERLDVEAEPVTDSTGETHYFHTVKTPVVSEDGAVVATVGVSRRLPDDDSSTRRQAQRTARKAGISELRTLVADIPLPLMMCDSRLRILERSDAWNASMDEGEPAHNDVFFDEAYGSRIPVAKLLREVIATDGQAEARGLEVSLASGSIHTIDIVARAWRLASGEVGGAVLIVHDVTEMTNTQSLLKRANEELTQFNYRASHDLRGPLRTIMGLIDLAKSDIRDGDSKAALHALDRASASSERLSDLVTRLLDLARLDAADLDDTDTELGPVVQEILREHAPELEAAGFDVSMSLDCEIVHGARTRIHQALENLVSNTVKYFDPSEAQPRLEVKSGRDDLGTWIEVRDNGRGFAQPSRAFELFSRESSRASGVGLGLHIVKKHVAWLGGTVEIVSPRKDTVICIRIPDAKP